jgi:hypothetical protein
MTDETPQTVAKRDVRRRTPGNRIFRSASKVAFLGLMLTACVGFLLGTLPVDQFMLLATAASAFYFTKSKPESDVS